MTKRNDNDDILEYISYFPETGQFLWAISPNKNMRAGAIAGGHFPCGSKEHFNLYRQIRFRGKLYMGHRIAWRIVHGYWPSTDIDHINRDSTDNRFGNLRIGSHSRNAANCAVRRTSKSGLKGVGWAKHANKWKAKIKDGSKQRHLGYFHTPEEAHAAYSDAARRIFGEFASP